MNAVTQSEQTALTLPQRAAVALGESANEAKLRELVAKSSGIVSVTNDAGRDEAHRAGMVLLKTRTGIRATGKAARDDATKFSKAVIAMEDELIGIIEPEETRVLALRDAWDEQIAAEKAAKIAAERARVDTIQACLQNLRDFPLQAVGKPSKEISVLIGILVAVEPGASFEEFLDQAKTARLEALDKLAKMETAQRGVEIEAEAKRQEDARIAAEAEQARIAEAARIEQERATLAAQRAENERVANEQAAERKRLADLAAAQERAATELREKAEANARAEREAQAEANRKEQVERDRVAAETKRQLDAQQAQIAADRKALAEERQAAEDARRRDEDHGPALAMNAEFDAEREAERQRLRALADQHLNDGPSLASMGVGVDTIALPGGQYYSTTTFKDNGKPILCNADGSRSVFCDVDDIDELMPTDDEIRAMGSEFGLSDAEWVERLELFVVAARAELVAA